MPAHSRIESLGHVDFLFWDLPANLLGLTAGNTVWIDRDAAGWGWLIDSTTGRNREFAWSSSQGEQPRMDLLTTVIHELGHVLGWAHFEDADDVMLGALAAGQRRSVVPTSDLLATSMALLELAHERYRA